jgi:hypothetical protein
MFSSSGTVAEARAGERSGPLSAIAHRQRGTPDDPVLRSNHLGALAVKCLVAFRRETPGKHASAASAVNAVLDAPEDALYHPRSRVAD